MSSKINRTSYLAPLVLFSIVVAGDLGAFNGFAEGEEILPIREALVFMALLLFSALLSLAMTLLPFSTTASRETKGLNAKILENKVPFTVV